MTLNLPLLYVLWLEEYCQISPNKNRSPNLWHVTSILVCCIFAYLSWNCFCAFYSIVWPAKINNNLKASKISFLTLGDSNKDIGKKAQKTSRLSKASRRLKNVQKGWKRLKEAQICSKFSKGSQKLINIHHRLCLVFFYHMYKRALF